jgi:hypothetical protein
MSGAEPLAILGAISAIIALFETSKRVYDAAKDAKGLHESFRKASDNVAIILSTLYQARLVQEQTVKAYESSPSSSSSSVAAAQKQHIESESRAIAPIMNLCKTNAEALSEIFTSIFIQQEKASRIRRYASALGNSMPSKKRRVQTLMRETMEGLQLLHTYHSFSAMTTMGQLQAATRSLPVSTTSSTPDGVAECQSPPQQGTRVMGDARLGMRSKQDHGVDPDGAKNTREGSVTLDESSHNVWMNASGTKVMNQIGAQTVHGDQNVTL